MMIELIAPEFALRMKKGPTRSSPSPWHFQDKKNRMKTVCGIQITDYLGHRRFKGNPAFAAHIKKIRKLSRPKWERANLEEMKQWKGAKMCAACMGAWELAVIND